MFAYRSHKTFVNLDPGQSYHFRLAPMTPGTVVFKVVRIEGGPLDLTGDHPLSGQSYPSIVEWSRVPDLFGSGRERERAIPARRLSTRRLPNGPSGGTEIDPDIDFDPEIVGVDHPNEITLSLYYGSGMRQTKTGANIFLSIGETSDAWSLKMSRAADPTGHRARYMVYAQYPSALPLLDRRIPFAGLRNGFAANWTSDSQDWASNNSYVEMVNIAGNHLRYRWNEHFAQLYNVEREGEIHLTGKGEFPEIVGRNITVTVGYEKAVEEIDRDYPYFALRVEFECKNSTSFDIHYSPDDAQIPRTFYFDVRFYLQAWAGMLSYFPRITTDLEFSDSVLASVCNDNLHSSLSDKQKELSQAQIGAAQNTFDSTIRPWVVGHYEIVDVEVDAAADAVVFWYVGRPTEQPYNVSDGVSPPQNWDALPRLFATAGDEVWHVFQLNPSTIPHPRPEWSAGSLDKIEHIVVLMQENRSFDQVFGYLSRDGDPTLGLQDVDGLLPGDNDRDVNFYQRSAISQPEAFRSRATSATDWPWSLPGPCHGRDCVKAQITDGMKSFVKDFARRTNNAPDAELQRIMDYYTPDALPVYAALAREFALCDRWFCSHIGGTLPNRHITLSGDLNFDQYGLPEEDNSEFNGYAPSERLTFFDHLTRHNTSWKVYEHGYSFLRLYRNYTFEFERIAQFGDAQRGFAYDCANNALPSVSFIEPDYIEAPLTSNDDHAPADMWNGQRLIADIVRSLIRSDLWPKTALIITYDEHGGFYDHLIPPDQVATGAPGGFRPIPPLANGVRQLGVRVPALIVSPFVAKGESALNVDHAVYEHASIPASILRRFTGRYLPRQSPRVEAANDIRNVLTLDAASARTADQFGELLQLLDSVAESPARGTDAPRRAVPIQKIADRTSDEFREDFHGFMAYASSLTGRGV